MTVPFTTKKQTAEEVIQEKVDKLADDAETIEEIGEVQELIKNQQDIKNSKKKTLLGVEPKDWLAMGVSLAQIGVIIKAEEFRVLTSKAMNFVHKGRLR